MIQQLHQTLRDHLESATHRVIREAIHGSDAEVAEKPSAEPRTVSYQPSFASE